MKNRPIKHRVSILGRLTNNFEFTNKIIIFFITEMEVKVSYFCLAQIYIAPQKSKHLKQQHNIYIKMPVDGIPSALEKALDVLFQENVLTSWSIKGGLFTTVTLRFDNQNGDFQGHAASTPRTYRPKPPSAFRRDNNRRQQWMASKAGNKLQSNSVAPDLELTVTEDANFQASQIKIDCNLDSACKGDHYVNDQHVSVQPSISLNENKRPVYCSTTHSTTPLMSEHSERSAMLMSHVTLFHENETCSFSTPEINKQSSQELLKSKCVKDKSSSRFPFPKWNRETVQSQAQNCSYCNAEIHPGEPVIQCTCLRRYKICDCCANRKECTELDFHVCSRMDKIT